MTTPQLPLRAVEVERWRLSLYQLATPHCRTKCVVAQLDRRRLMVALHMAHGTWHMAHGTSALGRGHGTLIAKIRANADS
jgi:hypothetical protein